MSPDAAPVAHAAAAYGGVLAGAGGRQLETLQRGDTKAPFAVALYASPPYDVHVPAIDVARLSINLTDSPVSGHLDGDRACRFQTRRHSLFLAPAGAGAHWRKERPSRHINVYFDPAALGDDELPAFAGTPLYNAALPSARPLIERLAAELAGADPFAAEAADSLVRLILVELARQRLHGAAGSLSSAQLARVAEFVDANLERRLLVSELAQAAGLPPSRFAAAFVRGSGRSPHQYVLEQRIERAATLLARSREPLADVAAACGFASQQHMTRLLRGRRGVTPGRLRLSAST